MNSTSGDRNSGESIKLRLDELAGDISQEALIGR